MSTVRKCDRCGLEITKDQHRVRLTVEPRPSYQRNSHQPEKAAEILERVEAIHKLWLILDLHHDCYVEHYQPAIQP